MLLMSPLPYFQKKRGKRKAPEDEAVAPVKDEQPTKKVKSDKELSEYLFSIHFLELILMRIISGI